MSSDWSVVSTEELIADGQLLINDGYRAKNSEMGPDGLPFVRAGDIDGRISVEGADVLAAASVVRAGEKVSQPGDAVFTSKGTVGRFAFVSASSPRFVYSPQLCFWRVRDRDRLDPRFVFFWLQGPEARGQLHALKGQTDMADYVSLRDQRAMTMTLPPFDEQRRIAGVLGALDDKIEHNRTLAERLESLAALEFKHRFLAETQDRVPLSTHARTWKDSVNPAHQPDARFEHFSIPAFDSERLPSIERGDKILSSKTALPASPCVLVSKLNPATKRVWWPQPSGKGKPVCSSEFLCLIPRESAPAEFIYSSFLADDVLYDELLSHATGTTGSRQRVKPSEVLSCGIVRASAEELVEWKAFAGPVYALAAAMLEETVPLTEARDALLSKLVSGKIRVPESYEP